MQILSVLSRISNYLTSSPRIHYTISYLTNSNLMFCTKMGHCVAAPASNHCLISSRSPSVIPVELFIGMILVTTACW